MGPTGPTGREGPSVLEGGGNHLSAETRRRYPCCRRGYADGCSLAGYWQGRVDVQQAMELQTPPMPTNDLEDAGTEESAQQQRLYPEQVPMPYLNSPMARIAPRAPKARPSEAWPFAERERP